MQSVQILTDVARKSSPDQKRLRLDEWMAIRPIEPKELAAEIGTTEASVSRWKKNKRLPRKDQMKALEEFFGVGPGGLYRSPDSASDNALLAGLDQARREEALRFIAFLRTKK